MGRREGGEGELGILERAQWGWRARERLERKDCGMCPVRFIWGGCLRLKERAVSAACGCRIAIVAIQRPAFVTQVSMQC